MIDRSIRLSEHFTLGEFISPNDSHIEAYWLTGPVTFTARLRELAGVLEKVRTHFGGRPVRINSGIRSREHNTEVGGATDSQHPHARAADVTVDGIAPSEVTAYVKTLPEVGGVGSYSTWTHVDVRPRNGGPMATWEGP